MSVDKEMIPLLSLFKPKNRILNPWQNQLPKVFKQLNLKKGMKVIDIPCGQGGVSVPLAKKYKVKITGYDIFPAYVRYSRQYAKQKGVAHLCKFKVSDIRAVVKQKNICDCLLWVGSPHVWGKAKPTIKRLRNLVCDGGIIVIADAYLYPKVKQKGMYKDYETLKNTTKGYISQGDKLIKIYDCRRTLWKFDYDRTRKEVSKGVKRAKTKKDRSIVREYLASLDGFQDKETKDLGTAIWVLRVNK